MRNALITPGAGGLLAILATSGYHDFARELLVPLREEHALGRFDRDGTLAGRVPLPVGDWAIDAGQRSLLGLF